MSAPEDGRNTKLWKKRWTMFRTPRKVYAQDDDPILIKSMRSTRSSRGKKNSRRRRTGKVLARGEKGNGSGRKRTKRRHSLNIQMDQIRKLQESHRRLTMHQNGDRRRDGPAASFKTDSGEPLAVIAADDDDNDSIWSHTIFPFETWKQVWDILILLLVMISAIHIPLLLGFPDIDDLGAVQVFIDILFIADFILCFRTGYMTANGEIEMRQTEIVKHYSKTWMPIDLAACFPLDFLFPSEKDTGTRAKTMLRLLKLPRMLRLGRLFKYLARLKYAGAMKIVRFIFSLVIVAHWTGCLFFFLCNIENEFGYGTWIEKHMGVIVHGEDLSRRYLTCLYTAFLLLIGEGTEMVTEVELLFGSCAALVGTIIIAIIVGNVSFVVSNQNSTAFQYQSSMDLLADEMRAIDLPEELKDRVVEYFEYLWLHHRTFDLGKEGFTSNLNPTLRREILLYLNREFILNCDFFAHVSNDCMHSLIHNFTFAIFLKGDRLATEGDDASGLVIITSGSARVEKRGVVFAQEAEENFLEVGDYFGERSVLQHEKNQSSVYAEQNCDTRILLKEVFEEIADDFPDLRDFILNQSNHIDVTSGDGIHSTEKKDTDRDRTTEDRTSAQRTTTQGDNSSTLLRDMNALTNTDKRPDMVPERKQSKDFDSSVTLALDNKLQEVNQRMGKLEEKMDSLLAHLTKQPERAVGSSNKMQRVSYF